MQPGAPERTARLPVSFIHKRRAPCAVVAPRATIKLTWSRCNAVSLTRRSDLVQADSHLRSQFGKLVLRPRHFLDHGGAGMKRSEVLVSVGLPVRNGQIASGRWSDPRSPRTTITSNW